MNISEVLSTPERERILKTLLYSTQERSLYKIAKEARVSPAQVHKYLNILKKNGLYADKQLKNNTVTTSLRLLENILFLQSHALGETIKKNITSVDGIGIYGSWARGSNDESSDVDVWVLVPKTVGDLEVAKLRRNLENKIERKVDLTIITREKIEKLRETNPNLYYSIYNSVKLWGESL